MLGIAQRLAQVKNTVAQIVQRSLVAGLAPKQRRQLPPWLAAIRAEGKIGEKHALALSGHCHFLTPGELAQLEVAIQTKRPKRPSFYLIVGSQNRIHSSFHRDATADFRHFKRI